MQSFFGSGPDCERVQKDRRRVSMELGLEVEKPWLSRAFQTTKNIVYGKSTVVAVTN